MYQDRQREPSVKIFRSNFPPILRDLHVERRNLTPRFVLILEQRKENNSYPRMVIEHIIVCHLQSDTVLLRLVKIYYYSKYYNNYNT